MEQNNFNNFTRNDFSINNNSFHLEEYNEKTRNNLSKHFTNPLSTRTLESKDYTLYNEKNDGEENINLKQNNKNVCFTIKSFDSEYEKEEDKAELKIKKSEKFENIIEIVASLNQKNALKNKKIKEDEIYYRKEDINLFKKENVNKTIIEHINSIDSKNDLHEKDKNSNDHKEEHNDILLTTGNKNKNKIYDNEIVKNKISLSNTDFISQINKFNMNKIMEKNINYTPDNIRVKISNNNNDYYSKNEIIEEQSKKIIFLILIIIQSYVLIIYKIILIIFIFIGDSTYKYASDLNNINSSNILNSFSAKAVNKIKSESFVNSETNKNEYKNTLDNEYISKQPAKNLTFSEKNILKQKNNILLRKINNIKESQISSFKINLDYNSNNTDLSNLNKFNNYKDQKEPNGDSEFNIKLNKNDVRNNSKKQNNNKITINYKSNTSEKKIQKYNVSYNNPSNNFKINNAFDKNLIIKNIRKVNTGECENSNMFNKMQSLVDEKTNINVLNSEGNLNNNVRNNSNNNNNISIQENSKNNKIKNLISKIANNINEQYSNKINPKLNQIGNDLKVKQQKTIILQNSHMKSFISTKTNNTNNTNTLSNLNMNNINKSTQIKNLLKKPNPIGFVASKNPSFVSQNEMEFDSNDIQPPYNTHKNSFLENLKINLNKDKVPESQLRNSICIPSEGNITANKISFLNIYEKKKDLEPVNLREKLKEYSASIATPYEINKDNFIKDSFLDCINKVKEKDIPKFISNEKERILTSEKNKEKDIIIINNQNSNYKNLNEDLKKNNNKINNATKKFKKVISLNTQLINYSINNSKLQNKNIFSPKNNIKTSNEYNINDCIPSDQTNTNNFGSYVESKILKTKNSNSTNYYNESNHYINSKPQSTKNKLKISINKNYIKSPVNTELRSHKNIFSNTNGNIKNNEKEKVNNINTPLQSSQNKIKIEKNINLKSNEINENKTSINYHNTLKSSFTEHHDKYNEKIFNENLHPKTIEDKLYDEKYSSQIHDKKPFINNNENESFQFQIKNCKNPINNNEYSNMINLTEISDKIKIPFTKNNNDKKLDLNQAHLDNLNYLEDLSLNKFYDTNENENNFDEELNKLELYPNINVLEYIANKLVEKSINNMENSMKTSKGYLLLNLKFNFFF